VRLTLVAYLSLTNGCVFIYLFVIHFSAHASVKSWVLWDVETSNRASTNDRAKVRHKVKETRKKKAKAAKKNPQWKSSESFFSFFLSFSFSLTMRNVVI